LSRLGKSYGQAFLEAAPPGYTVEKFLDTGREIADALRIPQVRAFFSAPAVPAPAKQGALSALAKKVAVDEYGERFLRLVLARGRLANLGEILSGLREELDRRRGVVEARVTVAAAISDADRRKIEASLSRQTGKQVRTIVNLDPSVLGGFVAKIGSQVYDASIAQAVERFRRTAAEKVGA
jgi:F-type H+-transporting ATPase subunit delta